MVTTTPQGQEVALATALVLAQDVAVIAMIFVFQPVVAEAAHLAAQELAIQAAMDALDRVKVNAQAVAVHARIAAHQLVKMAVKVLVILRVQEAA